MTYRERAAVDTPLKPELEWEPHVVAFLWASGSTTVTIALITGLARLCGVEWSVIFQWALGIASIVSGGLTFIFWCMWFGTLTDRSRR